MVEGTNERTKAAIFDPAKQAALLTACVEEEEWCTVWIILNTGMHPKNLVRLGPSNVDVKSGEWFLQYQRVKNDKARRYMLPPDVGERLRVFVAKRKRVQSTKGVWGIVKRVGARVGMPDVSPLSLRHTFCINLLREHDDIHLVAQEMGCSVQVVMRNYADLHAWKKLRARKTETDG